MWRVPSQLETCRRAQADELVTKLGVSRAGPHGRGSLVGSLPNAGGSKSRPWSLNSRHALSRQLGPTPSSQKFGSGHALTLSIKAWTLKSHLTRFQPWTWPGLRSDRDRHQCLIPLHHLTLQGKQLW